MASPVFTIIAADPFMGLPAAISLPVYLYAVAPKAVAEVLDSFLLVLPDDSPGGVLMAIKAGVLLEIPGVMALIAGNLMRPGEGEKFYMVHCG